MPLVDPVIIATLPFNMGNSFQDPEELNVPLLNRRDARHA
jgi:hypothetical protein